MWAICKSAPMVCSINRFRSICVCSNLHHPLITLVIISNFCHFLNQLTLCYFINFAIFSTFAIFSLIRYLRTLYTRTCCTCQATQLAFLPYRAYALCANIFFISIRVFGYRAILIWKIVVWLGGFVELSDALCKIFLIHPYLEYSVQILLPTFDRTPRVNLGAAFLGKRASLPRSLKFVLCEKNFTHASLTCTCQ